MRKQSLWSVLWKNLRRAPRSIAIAHEYPRLDVVATAADVQLALVTGNAVERAMIARLAAVLPLGAAQVAVDASRVIAARRDASPIHGARGSVQFAVMNDQWKDAGRPAVAHPPAVGPLLAAVVAVDVTPIFLVLRVDRGGVQMALIHGERVADVVARKIGPAAVLPLAALSIVDAKMYVTISSLRLIPAGAGVDRQGNAAPGRRIVQVEHVSNDVVEFLRRIDPRRECEVPGPELKRLAGGHFKIGADAVELAVGEIDAMVHAVIALPRRVAAVAQQFPMADETRLSKSDRGESKGYCRGY
jgi:hypothetical protein